MAAKGTPGNTPSAKVQRSRSAPIIERAPLPIVEVQGRAHTVTYVNSAFCTLLGKTRAELVGQQFDQIVPGGDGCVQILDGVYATGEAATHALKDPSESNPAYWLYAMWPALDSEDRPVGVIIQLTKAADFRKNAAEINEALLISGLRQHELTEVAENLNTLLQKEIAERKLAQAELQEAKDWLANQASELELLVALRTEKLRETVGELEAFSYSVAHDLRAPLRAVQGYSQSLLDDYADKLDETGKTYLERMSRSAIRMDKLIQDVLSYTKIVRAQVPLESIDFDTLLRDIIDAMPEWHPPRVEIRIEGKLPKVLGNEALLGQCITNLMSNAVKFVSSDTRPSVMIGTEIIHDRVRVWFEDKGVGIAPQNHLRVFRMFERIHPASEYDGTGIGLTIVRKAVERMGGLVGFESQLGKGSRFWIELPKGIEE